MLFLAVIPVVVYLLHGVLKAARSIVPNVQADRDHCGRRLEGPRCDPRSLTTQEQVAETVAGVAELRRLARRDPRRRGRSLMLTSSAAGVVTIIGVVLIVLALVYYLVSTILALQKITKGLDEVIGSVVEIVEKTAPVNGVVDSINGQLDAGVDLLEGLLVQKAGMQDAIGLVEGLYAGSAAAGFRSFPESATTKAPRIAEVYTRERSRSPGSAARRRSPRPTRPGPSCGTSRAAASRHARSTPTSATRAPRSCRARPSSARTRPSSTSSVTTSALPASDGPRPRPLPTRETAMTPERVLHADGARSGPSSSSDRKG